MIAFWENRTNAFHISERKRLGCAAHLHHHLELVLFLEGDCVGFADAERCEIAAGDAFLAFPEQVHRFESHGPERLYILIVEPELMPELSSLFSGSFPESALIKGGAQDKLLLEAAEQLLAMKNPETVAQKAIRKGLLLTIFGKILQKCALTDTHAGTSNAFRAVVEYCTAHYDSDLSLSILERELHISKYYISHLFSARLRISFNDYVNSLRVSHACRFLREDKHSITEIGSLVGFSTLRTFNRAFQKQMGQTPSEYKKSIGKDKL
ncbi:MAG: AraC family transcriptional regulator [Ruminococcaceae bacterium]|nr:AraC family transcriptional regulator [Oscillospiraceae bacterium]